MNLLARLSQDSIESLQSQYPVYGVIPVAKFVRRFWHGPDPAASTIRYGFEYVFPSVKAKYKGRVAALIHARSMSAAEQECLYLGAATDATFIGSATRGATQVKVRTIYIPFSTHAESASSGNTRVLGEEEAKTKIADILAQIRAGADFGSLAQGFSEERQPNGFYLFRAEAVEIRTFQDVQGEIAEIVRQENFKRRLDEMDKKHIKFHHSILNPDCPG